VDLPERWFLVLVPACHVSTGEIFSNEQLTRNSPAIKMAAFFQGHSRNDTQLLVRSLYPDVDRALIVLESFGEARLTGTGACVFTSFEHESDARAAQKRLPTEYRSIVARGINTSPVLQALA
jgi:4-diphosphocytidyl-2-C-methyl-D-erythritol kinase